jgi:putative ABC transport system ATP-binding protein
VLRLFEVLHSSGMTLVIVTHDDRVACAADRVISMRDGAFVDELLTSGTTGNLADFARIGG